MIAEVITESSSCKLGDFAEIIMGQSPTGDTCNTGGFGFPLLNGPTEFGSKHPSPVQFTTNPKKFAKPGDLLFCVRGSTTGKMNWADQDYAIGRGIAAIRGINEYPNSFIRAVIELKLESLLVQATGSTFPNVSKDLINGMIIPCISVENARMIASILDPLDDKIALNREMNKTLEAMAQAIYKSWFVDFEPFKEGELIESELGMIPKGWEVGTFKQCCMRVESGGTPSRSKSEFWNGSIPWLTSGEVRDVIVLDTKEKISDEGLNSSSAKLWKAMTTVIAMYGATAGQVCLLAEPMSANQACCALIPKSEFQSFIFLAARQSINELADKASGSAQQNLNKSLVENHATIFPPLSVGCEFEEITSKLIKKWIENERENKLLSTLRDTLLPKLLNGEIEV